MDKRSLFLVSSLSVTVLSLLTAFKVVPGPEIFGIWLAFLALFLIPGLYIVYLFFGRIPVTAEGFARVFLSGVVFSSLTLLAGAIPGAGYRSVSLSSATITAGMVFLCYVRSGRRSYIEPMDLVGRFRSEDDLSRREKKALMLLAGVMFVLCFLLFYGWGETGIDTDAPDHISYIARSVLSGSLLPDDSFFKGGDGEGFDPRKGTWQPVIALWAYQADTSVDFLWQVLPAFLAFFYLLAFWVFARELLQSIPLALIASVFLLVMYRGGGLEWLTKAAYSKNVMHLIFWMTSAYILRYLRDGRGWTIAAAAILAACGTSIHVVFPFLIAAVFVSIAIYSLLREAEVEWRPRLLAMAPVLLASTVIPLIVRFFSSGRTFNTIHTHTQGMLVFSDRLSMVDPVEVLSHCGMGVFIAILLAILIVIADDRNGRGRLAGIMFLVPAVLVLNPLTGSVMQSYAGYLYYRMLDAAPVNAVFAAAVAWSAGAFLSHRDLSGRKRDFSRYLLVRITPALVVILLSIGGLRLYAPAFLAHTGSLAGGSIGEVEEKNGVLLSLLNGIEDGSVVFSDPVTSYTISAFSDHFVTSVPGQHGNPTDLNALERLRETRDLFSPYIPFRSSMEWIEKEGISHIVVNNRDNRVRGFFNTFPEGAGRLALEKLRGAYPFLIETERRGGYVLFAVDSEKTIGRSAHTSLLTTPECATNGNPIETPDMKVFTSDIPGDEAGPLMILENLNLDSTIVSRGDTLRGSFCWRLDGGEVFGLPMEWTVRLDRNYPHGAFYREWYAKQYRRSVERKTGIFYRKTVTGRIMGSIAHPDLWAPGETVRQGFNIPVPLELATGEYELTISVRRIPYLINRIPEDYLSNRDSHHGPVVAKITVVEHD